jgi:hypothetical protein
LTGKSKKGYTHIEHFDPDVEVYNTSHQDLLFKFDAGDQYINFNDFISKEAEEYADGGEGVTYLVWNILYNDDDKELSRELVGYYTLAATAIPYIDRIRLDEEEAQKTGNEFSCEICGITAIEIKMFAIDKKYQDLFYCYEGEDLPISAWILRKIIDYSYSLLTEVLGFKALFLHSLPEAESFYRTNGFHPVEVNMQPLHCIDSEYKAMYLTLKEVHMNFDE